MLPLPKEAFTVQLGQNIRKLRKKSSLTVEQLALETGLTYSQISRIELGKIKTSAYTTYLIAKTLKINLSKLFEFDN